MMVLPKYRAKVTVLAAKSGLRVEAMTDIVERINKIISRFHSGQFCHVSATMATKGRICWLVQEDHWGRH